MDNVKAAVSPKVKASFNSVKAAVSPSNIVNACRRASRRTASGKEQSRLSDDDKADPHAKLNPEEVKQQLGTCGRLDILRSRLLKINKCGSKVRDFKKDIETADAVDQVNNNYEKPTQTGNINCVKSNPDKVKTAKINTCNNNDPAYERYLHLASNPEGGLTFPAKHKVLNDYFKAVDTVISLLHNRQEVATFSKLQIGVQDMLKKNFSQDTLAKINTVFPEAYAFRQEKTKNLMGVMEYNLVVTPCFSYKDTSSAYIKMTSTILSERRNMFQNCLIEIIKTHHDTFLETLDEPHVSADDLKRWHPEFDLAEIPDVEMSTLPKRPESDEKLDSAVDVLSKAMDMFNIRQAESSPPAVVESKSDSASLPSAPANTALKGVSSSLLEKIRAREAAKAAHSAFAKSNEQTKEIQMLKRLPEVARILRNTFITERKVALPWEMVVKKVSSTYSSTIHDRDVDNHLNRLLKEAPGWLTVCKVSSGTYLKIDKKVDVNDIIVVLCNLLKSKQ